MRVFVLLILCRWDFVVATFLRCWNFVVVTILRCWNFVAATFLRCLNFVAVVAILRCWSFVAATFLCCWNLDVAFPASVAFQYSADKVVIDRAECREVHRGEIVSPRPATIPVPGRTL